MRSGFISMSRESGAWHRESSMRSDQGYRYAAADGGHRPGGGRDSGGHRLRPRVGINTAVVVWAAPGGWGATRGYPAVITGPFPPVFVRARSFTVRDAGQYLRRRDRRPQCRRARSARWRRGNAGGKMPVERMPRRRCRRTAMMAVGGAGRRRPMRPSAPRQAAHDEHRSESRGRASSSNTATRNSSSRKYNSAVERYREAATTAPDLADPYFRQAFALLGSSQYESASRRWSVACASGRTGPTTKFELATIYGPDGRIGPGHRIAKRWPRRSRRIRSRPTCWC